MRSLLKLLALSAMFAIGAASSMNALAAEKQQILQDRQDLMINQGRQWLVIRNYLQDKADQAAALSAVESFAKTGGLERTRQIPGGRQEGCRPGRSARRGDQERRQGEGPSGIQGSQHLQR